MLGHVIRFLTEHWTLKLAAIVLALLLWLTVRASTPKRTTFRNVPVQVDLRDPDWRLVGEPIPSVVSVMVIGPTSELMALSADPPRVVLPVQRVSDSTETQVVSPQWIRIPQGLRQTRIEGLRPDTIRLRYERLESRILPVRIRTRGDLPQGLALALPITTNPSAVDVRGPGRLLEGIDSVPLLPVDLSGLRATTNVPARVDTIALPGLMVTPNEINVILRVVPTDSQPGLQRETVARRRVPPRIR
ncbi:MAG TPA: YbbR-like domain-containing protein [Longimicrobiales bacterium]|nr:YbbR-like domain-containing protein [Longimicrobiales bacterium]